MNAASNVIQNDLNLSQRYIVWLDSTRKIFLNMNLVSKALGHITCSQDCTYIHTELGLLVRWVLVDHLHYND